MCVINSSFFEPTPCNRGPYLAAVFMSIASLEKGDGKSEAAILGTHFVERFKKVVNTA
jgi:hypothetical protein